MRSLLEKTMFWELQKGRWTKYTKKPKIDRMESCTYIMHMIPSNLSPFLDPIGKKSKMGGKKGESRAGAGKFSKV